MTSFGYIGVLGNLKKINNNEDSKFQPEMKKLIKETMQEDPDNRPSLQDFKERFDKLKGNLLIRKKLTNFEKVAEHTENIKKAIEAEKAGLKLWLRQFLDK